MQSPVHKEENPTKLRGSRHLEYFRKDLKYNSLETGRSMRTLAASLLLCYKCRLFCKSYAVKSQFILAPSTKATVAGKLWMSSLDTLLFYHNYNAIQCQSRKNSAFSAHIDTNSVLGCTWKTHFFILFCS